MRENSLMSVVLEAVREHPGLTRDQLREYLPEIRPSTLGGYLNRLAKQGLLENRGGSVNRFDPAIWYPVPVGAIHKHSITRKVLDFVRGNPGCRRADILEALPETTNLSTVSNVMQVLAEKGAIENRGGISKKARWYAVEIPAEKKYAVLAQEILEDLKAIHHTQREAYLAARLQEVCDGKQGE